MFGKVTLAEIKAKLASRGISIDGNRLTVKPTAAPQEATELEKTLNKILEELERKIKERKKPTHDGQ